MLTYCKMTSTSYWLPLDFWWPTNLDPLYNRELDTPGCLDLTGGKGAATFISLWKLLTGIFQKTGKIFLKGNQTHTMNIRFDKRGNWQVAKNPDFLFRVLKPKLKVNRIHLKDNNHICHQCRWDKIAWHQVNMIMFRMRIHKCHLPQFKWEKCGTGVKA